MSRSRLGLDRLADPSFGPHVLPELGRVVGANVMHERTEGAFSSDDELARRCAEFCAPLDAGLREDFLGVIDVAPNEAEPWKAVPAATAVLDASPRGTWAILRSEGGYQAFMANGLGGSASRTGHQFTARSPEAEGMTFLDAYAAVLGTATYEMRGRVRAAIDAASFEAAGDLTGRVATDAYLKGKTWARVEAIGISPDIRFEDRPAVLVRATRRGVRAETLAVAPSSCVALFGLAPVLPAEFAATDGIDRTRTLAERRLAAAKAAYAEAVEATPGALPRDYPMLRLKGDVARGGLYVEGDAPGQPSIPFEVAFAPGSDEVEASPAAVPGR